MSIIIIPRNSVVIQVTGYLHLSHS